VKHSVARPTNGRGQARSGRLEPGLQMQQRLIDDRLWELIQPLLPRTMTATAPASSTNLRLLVVDHSCDHAAVLISASGGSGGVHGCAALVLADGALFRRGGTAYGRADRGLGQHLAMLGGRVGAPRDPTAGAVDRGPSRRSITVVRIARLKRALTGPEGGATQPIAPQ
jgi:hypothetical protein